jgi:hypothetical protein
MSRKPKMVSSPYAGPLIPQSEATFLRKIFESAILKRPGGAVRRAASMVLHKSSEARLLTAAKIAGMTVRLRGEFYWIERPTAAFLLYRAA